jgi:hypothetical protein
LHPEISPWAKVGLSVLSERSGCWNSTAPAILLELSSHFEVSVFFLVAAAFVAEREREAAERLAAALRA